jgi:hypothetical protein
MFDALSAPCVSANDDDDLNPGWVQQTFSKCINYQQGCPFPKKRATRFGKKHHGRASFTQTSKAPPTATPGSTKRSKPGQNRY